MIEVPRFIVAGEEPHPTRIEVGYSVDTAAFITVERADAPSMVSRSRRLLGYGVTSAPSRQPSMREAA